MSYEQPFSEFYGTAQRHMGVALDELADGTWSGTDAERRLSERRFADMKAARIAATREAMRHVCAAIRALTAVSPEN